MVHIIRNGFFWSTSMATWTIRIDDKLGETFDNCCEMAGVTRQSMIVALVELAIIRFQEDDPPGQWNAAVQRARRVAAESRRRR